MDRNSWQFRKVQLKQLCMSSAKGISSHQSLHKAMNARIDLLNHSREGKKLTRIHKKTAESIWEGNPFRDDKPLDMICDVLGVDRKFLIQQGILVDLNAPNLNTPYTDRSSIRITAKSAHRDTFLEKIRIVSRQSRLFASSRLVNVTLILTLVPIVLASVFLVDPYLFPTTITTVPRTNSNGNGPEANHSEGHKMDHLNKRSPVGPPIILQFDHDKRQVKIIRTEDGELTTESL